MGGWPTTAGAASPEPAPCMATVFTLHPAPWSAVIDSQNLETLMDCTRGDSAGSRAALNLFPHLGSVSDASCCGPCPPALRERVCKSPQVGHLHLTAWSQSCSDPHDPQASLTNPPSSHLESRFGPPFPPSRDHVCGDKRGPPPAGVLQNLHPPSGGLHSRAGAL